MVLMLLRLLLGCLRTLMSGLMVALCWIRSQVYPPRVLGSTLISRKVAQVIEGGVMLIVFVQVMRCRLVEVSAPFLGLFSLSKGLKCGESFWLCSHLLLFTWVLTIWVCSSCWASA